MSAAEQHRRSLEHQPRSGKYLKEGIGGLKIFALGLQVTRLSALPFSHQNMSKHPELARMLRFVVCTSIS